MPKKVLDFEMPDDSGFLALVDPNSYIAFFGGWKSFNDLSRHFRGEMKQAHLLFWGTGMGNFWKVRIVFEPMGLAGFREKTGTIRCTGRKLLLSNYEGLSMVAQFKDQKLPQACDESIPLNPGLYNARIVQVNDPEDPEAEETDFDFLIELLPTTAVIKPWTKIPWCSDYT